MAASSDWPAFQDSFLFKVSRVTHKFYCTQCSPPGQGKARHMTAEEALEHERSDPTHRKHLEGRIVAPPSQPTSPTTSHDPLTAAHLRTLGAYAEGAFNYADSVAHQVAFWNRSTAGAARGAVLRWADFFEGLDSRRERMRGWDAAAEYEDVDDFGVVVGPALPGTEVRRVKREELEWGSSGSDAEWALPGNGNEHWGEEGHGWAAEGAHDWGAAPGWEAADWAAAPQRNMLDGYGEACWGAQAQAEPIDPAKNLWADYDPVAADAARRKNGGFSGKWGREAAGRDSKQQTGGRGGQQGSRPRQNKPGGQVKRGAQNGPAPQKGAPQESKRTQRRKAAGGAQADKKAPARPRWFTEEVQI
ncbi:hypothetical protein HDZ31DRAFT_29422 [Schizophyllum fasciatum]